MLGLETNARGRSSSTGRLIVVLLVVLALGAVAETTAGRSVTTLEAPPTSSWRPVIRVGHQARARGDVPAARRAYLTALFRARGERSLAGVVSAAEGFEALGDGEVVERALRMAGALGPGDAAAGARLQALRERRSAAAALPMAVHIPR